ncbi:MAG: helix-turn-helix transcriptional regulator [Oscillospiraceae bacterium]|nr:helix-turn-helix transcriptional regulator [Oscillospiraceae bacterium]
MNNNFPRIITLLRKERKITQKQAAADLGVSQALLSHYEKGIRECGLNFLVRCADYYGVSCDYLLGRSPEPSGKTLLLEDIPAPDEQNRDAIMSGSILATLNKKLVANSLNVLFDLLAKSENHELLKLVSDSLFLNVYSLFRLVFSANGANKAELFKLSERLYGELAPAAMLRDQAYIRSSLGDKDSVNTEKLSISTDSLSKDYPLFATSLFNLIKNAEISLEEISKH